MPDQIRYVKRKDIDIQKWDECIRNAPNAIIYGYSFYLDAIAEQWDALIQNDYEAVMPLTWNEKLGIKYIYQPFFMAQSGIFGRTINNSVVDSFISSIPPDFKYVDIDLHESNISPAFAKDCSLRINMLLNLGQSYESLSNKYHRLAKRMIKKSIDAGIIIEKPTDIKACISFYKTVYESRLKIGTQAYERLTKMLEIAEPKGQAMTLCTRYEGEIAAVYFLMLDGRNVYSVAGGSSEKGKELGAFYFLTDFALQQVCNSTKIFRFEGSDKKEIAFFNHQFGADAIEYPHLKLNRLPIFLRWLKK